MLALTQRRGSAGHQRAPPIRPTAASRSAGRPPSCGCRAGRPRSGGRWPRGGGPRPAAAGSPALSAASWPQAAPASWPRLARTVTPTPPRRTRAANWATRSGRLACQGVWATGVHRDQVDVGQVAAQQAGQGVGVDVGVVHTGNHHVLVAHAPARYARVIASGGHDLRHGPATVQRHEHVAQRVAGGVQADRQRELRRERRQAPDAGHDARGRDDDVPRPQAEPARVGQDGHGLQDAVEVQERLAHAHEDDVRQAAAAVGGEAAGGVADLVDDLGRLEVAPEAQLAGGAEGAADGAAGLAGDAEGVALAMDRPALRRRALAPGSASAPTRSGPRRTSRWSVFSVRPPSATLTSSSAIVSIRKASARRDRSGAGRVRISSAVAACGAPDGVADLSGPIGRLTLGREPLLELAVGQAAQAGAGVRDCRGVARGRGGSAAGLVAGATVAAPASDSPVASVGSQGRDYRTPSPAGRPRGAAARSLGQPRRSSAAATRACRRVGPRPGRAGPLAVASARPSRPAATSRPATSPGSHGRDVGPPHDEPPARSVSEVAARPGLVGADLPLQLDRGPQSGSSSPSSRRSGRVSVTPSAGCGRACEPARQPLGQRADAAAAPPPRAARASSVTAVSSGRTSSGSTATIGPASISSVRTISVTARLRVAGEDRGRDRRRSRDAAAAPRGAG